MSESFAVQTHYEDCRDQGTSHNLALMFALGQPPMSNTDREFLERRGGCYDQFKGEELAGEYYRRRALAAGVNPTGKVYMSGLAAFPGDPQAWVSGRGDVQRVCEERGWGCEGSVKVKLQKVAEPTGGGVAQDIIDAEAVPLAQEAGIPVEEAREKVYDLRKPHWVKDGNAPGNS